jgi:hypothetical protein
MHGVNHLGSFVSDAPPPLAHAMRDLIVDLRPYCNASMYSALHYYNVVYSRYACVHVGLRVQGSLWQQQHSVVPLLRAHSRSVGPQYSTSWQHTRSIAPGIGSPRPCRVPQRSVPQVGPQHACHSRGCGSGVAGCGYRASTYRGPRAGGRVRGIFASRAFTHPPQPPP